MRETGGLAKLPDSLHPFFPSRAVQGDFYNVVAVALDTLRSVVHGVDQVLKYPVEPSFPESAALPTVSGVAIGAPEDSVHFLPQSQHLRHRLDFSDYTPDDIRHRLPIPRAARE